MVGLRSVLSGSCADEVAHAQWLWSTESCDWKSAVCWGRGRWILASGPRSTAIYFWSCIDQKYDWLAWEKLLVNFILGHDWHLNKSSHLFGRMTCQQWALLVGLFFMGLTIAEPWRNIGSSPHQEKKLANKHLIGSTRWFLNKNTPFQEAWRLMIILLRQLQRTNCLQTGSFTYLTWR